VLHARATRIARLKSRLAALTLLVVLLAWGAVPAIAGGDPDGSYRGELTDEDGTRYGEVRFKVAKDGRRIKKFRALPLAVCVNPDGIGGIEVVEVPFVFSKVKVKRNGRFAKSETVFADPPSDSSQTYELAGRLKNRRVRDGSVVLEGRCASTESFSAKRRSG
jgi:hypothetical protein